MLQRNSLTGRVIGCAFTVHNRIGFGFLEAVYENCMLLELKQAGLRVENQKPITVYYRGHNVGEYTADLVIEDSLIIELKAVRKIVEAHEVQLVNYLVATSIDCGLILNFAEQGVEVRRKVRVIDPS